MIAAACLFALASAPTEFAPPVDRPIRAVTESERTDNGVARRFTTARQIVFRRATNGYRAEVTVEAAPPGDPRADDPAAMFRAGLSRIAGRAIVLHIDAAGQVIAVEDQAALWRAYLDGVRALAPRGDNALNRQRAGRVGAVAAALATMPEDRQRATLASHVTALIAADLAAEGVSAPRSVRVPGQSAYGAVQLDGLRTTRRIDGLLEVTVTASGEVSVAGPDGRADGRTVIETVRRVDPASGLVMASSETVRTTAPDGSVAAERRSTTRLEF